MNIPARIGLGILFLGVVIVSSYGTKLHIDNLPYTLEYLDRFRGSNNANKFGTRFAKYFLSDDQKHKEHNRYFWEKNARRLVNSSKELLTDGFLKDLSSKKEAYNSAQTSSKPEKFKDLVDKLIIECTSHYTETSFSEDSSSSLWKEYWAYCSIDGKDRWDQHKK